MTDFISPKLTVLAEKAETLDPREPHPTRTGMFRDHNCWKYKSGELPCVNRHPNQCDYPQARND